MGCHSHVLALTKSPTNYVVLGLVRCRSDVANCLQNHTGHVQICAALLSLGHERVDGDLCDVGNVPESSRFVQQSQLLATSSRASQRSVLEVRRGAGPLSQAVLDFGRPVARRIVLVCEGKDVGGNRALVCLLQPRQTEGPRLEFARRRV